MISTTPFETFVNTVDSLVRLNEDMQLELEDVRKSMNPAMWAVEMATVSVSAGRRLGKTTYIKSRARCADLIIVPNTMMKAEYKGTRATVVTASELGQYGYGSTKYRGLSVARSYNRVYVDEPALVFKLLNLGDFYNGLTGAGGHVCCANTFILLGNAVGTGRMFGIGDQYE